MNGQINLGELKPFNYFLSVAVIIGLLFAVIAPDDQRPYGWAGQIVHWQLQVVVPMFLAIGVHYLLFRLGLFRNLNVWIKLVISGFSSALIFSPIAVLSDSLFANESIGESLNQAILDEFFAISFPILILWLAINAPFVIGWRVYKNQDEEKSSEQAGQEFSEVKKYVEQPNFTNLIPEEKRGELIFLKSELHYLLVVTDKGQSLILYSLTNAIAELEGVNGVQSHRSYWANQDHILSLNQQGREGLLEMSNGEQVPVSRRNILAVKKALNN